MKNRIGKTFKLPVLAPCPECEGLHKDIEFAPYTPKSEDTRLYTHQAICPETTKSIMGDFKRVKSNKK